MSIQIRNPFEKKNVVLSQHFAQCDFYYGNTLCEDPKGPWRHTFEILKNAHFFGLSWILPQNFAQCDFTKKTSYRGRITPYETSSISTYFKKRDHMEIHSES